MRLIDADSAIESLCNECKRPCDIPHTSHPCAAVKVIMELPSAELGGYSIEQLLFIAKLMESANVTPETFLNTLKDVEKTVRLVLELVRRRSDDAIMKIIMNGGVTE